MITLKQFLEAVEYRITEGFSYQWQCYGDKAYGLDSWDGEQDGSSFSVIFDQGDQTVYQVEAHDLANNRSYRMINPLFTEAHAAECASRGIPDVAYDGVEFIDLEVTEDFIEKTISIRQGLDYDTRIVIPLELSDSTMLTLMKQAHEKDITFNDHMENVLRDSIKLLGEKHGISS